MPTSEEGRLEEIARKARRVQDAIAGVRATAVEVVGRGEVARVRVETDADGHILTLEMPDSEMAQAVSRAHELSLQSALAQAAALREELTSDPAVAHALRYFARTAPERSHDAAQPNGIEPQFIADTVTDDPASPVALPRVPLWRSPQPLSDSPNAGAALGMHDASSSADGSNPYALPPAVRRRYGLV
ncbi:hypothetical protein VMT65_20320 [Nocardia sp. CDC153]|uniref:hypothetical protein n=1 Tax=Nocardia sp. CDC153 TaxID=3112167 RepID=UPI002DBB1039|nr:hypothetical protein [Nocardia sp. CDC153]MEC3955395.1 hypothetical protein [Nocardia sp. CDC153]